jgi:hypothetical protein
MSTTTQTQSITSRRAQIVALDAAIRDMEKAAKPCGKTKKAKARYLADDKKLGAVERACGEESNALLIMKPETDADIVALVDTLVEQALPMLDIYRDCLDEREQALVNLREAIIRRLGAS